MKIYCKFALTLGCFALFSRVASAQLPALSINPVETELQRVTILGYQSQADVTGAPYSAIEESLYSQRQPDGTYEDRSSTTTHIERDTQGRTRAERYMTSFLPRAGKPWLKSVFIADPVAGVLYCLDPTNHRANRAPWNPNTRALLDDASTMGHVASTRELQAHATTESLGVDTIEGLTVEGTRQTLTVPASAHDNDRPFKVVLQTWISPELKLAVLSTRDTPGGRRTTRLTKIDRSEPSPTLFSVPSDYAIEDAPVEEGSATAAVP